MFALMPWRKERTTGTLMPGTTKLVREFETLFDRVLGGWPVPLTETLELPRFWGLDMEEAEKEFVIRAELPGFDPKEIEVTLTGDVLTIEAARKEEPEVKEKEEKKERRYVKRSVTLPTEVEVEKMEAVYRNGVLEIHLPKTPEAAPRRIEVKT